MASHCKKFKGGKSVRKTIEAIEEFCKLLHSGKVQASRDAFVALPAQVRCQFLHHGWSILRDRKRYGDEAYHSAFLLFKLFRSKAMKERPLYQRYRVVSGTEGVYRAALEFERTRTKSARKSTKRSPAKSARKSASKRTSSRSTASKRSPAKRVKYEKEGQRYPTPEDLELNPAYLFYTSLLEQKPKAPLAITWLTERGIFDGKKREKLVKQYNALKAAGKLIR